MWRRLLGLATSFAPSTGFLYALGAAAVAAVLTATWWHGRMHERDKWQAFQAQADKVVAEARVRLIERIHQQKEVTYEVARAYADGADAIHAYYDRRLRNARAGAGRVPAVSPAARGVDAAAPQQAACGPGDPAFDALEERATRDAWQLIQLQAWIEQQAAQ